MLVFIAKFLLKILKKYLVIFLVRRYNLYLALLKAEDKVEHFATLKSTNLKYWLLLEILINSFHFPPFMPNFILSIPAMQEYNIDFQYSQFFLN